MDLKDKKAIVTGGSRGIGAAVVRALREANCQVGILDLLVDGPGVAECDVSDSAQVEILVPAMVARLGGVDILVNNAAIMRSEPLVRLDCNWKGWAERWDRIIVTGLSSVYYVTSLVVDSMVHQRTKGVIVNVSSVCAAGNAGQGAYSAAKAGVNALTVVWAKELSAWGIRVVGVAPGFTDTKGMREAIGETALQHAVNGVLVHELATPEQIADGVLWTIKNDFFNSRILQLDGGLVL